MIGLSYCLKNRFQTQEEESMNFRFLYQLFGLAAVAPLLFVALACGKDTTSPTPENRQTKPEARRDPAFTPQTEYLKYREISARAEAIRPKYEKLFVCQPNAWRVSIGIFQDEDRNYITVPDGEGGYSKIVGFIVEVTEEVPQEDIPPRYRLPDMIEGVPVQILERPIPETWGTVGTITTFDNLIDCEGEE